MNDEKNKLKAESKEASPKKKHVAQVKRLEEEIATLKDEAKAWENKYLRTLADMDNARKQNAREYEQMYKYRAVPFLEKLLPSLDVFSQVLRNEPEDQVLRNYLTGFKYVYAQLVEALSTEGLREVVVNVGDKFDEKTMHALDIIVDPDVPENTIKAVRNNTFFFEDRLIRPAQVSVSKLTQPVEDEEDSEEHNEECDPSTLN